MHGLVETARFQQRRFAVIVIGVLSVAASLWALGQPIAAALTPLIALLLSEILWRDLRARALARSISAGQAAEKIEVPPGAWGELSRAVNGLLQQRRLQQRIQVATPKPLPDDADDPLLDDGLASPIEQRIVSVLSVRWGCAQHVERDRRAAITAWQMLASVAQTQAQQHGALLQPCGDAMLLIFGALAVRSAETSAQAAISAAAALRRAWQGDRAASGGTLAVGLATGPALLAMVPGLGCNVLGAPVEQAMQIERLALAAPWFQMLCNESAYYALRHAHVMGWAATELSIHIPAGRPQTVYGLGQEPGVRSQASGVRDQGSGVRDQGSGVRSQEPGARSQESAS